MGVAVRSKQAFDYDAAVDRAISTCNGDLRGAVRALLIVNELLEAQVTSLTSMNQKGVSHERAA
ncbi:MAG: hypothetical protein EOO82_01830 [Oxalobacteraceae bacterium]|nr:MAG: hypothetical protein EOO82_01830 [Oxalobacteraceae bacterium]